MTELREGDPCPVCGRPVYPCGCEEEYWIDGHPHYLCSGCSNDATPDEDDRFSCDCPPLDDIDEDGWFVIYLANRGVMSLEWFREANPRPAGALWVPHHHGPGIAETIQPRTCYL